MRDLVAVVSDAARIEFYLNTFTTKQEIIDAVRRIPYVYGFTHTADALHRTRTEVYNPSNGDRASQSFCSFFFF